MQNTATVTGDQTDPESGNNTSTVTPAPIPQTDLAVTKTVNNATPNMGSNVTFTISVNNVGPSDATGVNVNDMLPSGYTYVSSELSSGTYTSGTGLWAVGSLANGAIETLTITAKVNATGPYANTATVTGGQTDPVSGNNTSTVTPAPIPQTDLAVTKTVDNAAPKVGANVTFTIVATNNGPSAATGVSVEDILPTGYTLVSASPSAGTSWAEPTWIIGDLANGATTSLTITATVKATGSYLNIAAINGDQADPISGNDFATSKPIPVPQTNLAVTKTVNNTTPFVGNNVIFTITATNNGPSAATGVKVTDNLPAGYTFVSATTTAGTSWSGSIWTIGNLANGASATLTITAKVKITGPYSNTATITGDQADPISGNDSAGATTTPVIPADLQVVKSASNLSPDVCANITFTIDVDNNGPYDATGVFVTDLLASGYTFISANPSSEYNAVTGVWTIGNLDDNESDKLKITATVNPIGSYVNTATISGAQGDLIRETTHHQLLQLLSLKRNWGLLKQ